MLRRVGVVVVDMRMVVRVDMVDMGIVMLEEEEEVITVIRTESASAPKPASDVI